MVRITFTDARVVVLNGALRAKVTNTLLLCLDAQGLPFAAFRGLRW
jgi:hypothetical protein